MTALIPANFGGLSTKFAHSSANDDLSSGVQSSFGLIGYKGKVWSIRYRGDEHKLMRDDGDGARGSIEVVILSASKSVAKIFYEQGYVEGSNAAPDCFSNNGITPEPSAAKKQCTSCALCKHNQWGSRITPAGKQGKACSDSKRVAVVPMSDIDNEMFGGPMLLRVPAASLQDLAMYGQKMNQMGYPYYSVATRIAFDPQEAFPKFIFGAIRPLNDEEADKVLAIRDGHQVQRILSENEFTNVQVEVKDTLATVFEQPPEPVNAAPTKEEVNAAEAEIAAKAAKEAAAQTAKAAAEAKAKKAAETKAKKEALAAELAAAEAVTAEVTESEEDREMREMEERLAAAKAKKAAAAAAIAASSSQASTQEQASPVVSNVGQTAQTIASPSEESHTTAFEADLDDMLNSLLP